MEHCLTCNINSGITPTPGGPVYSDDLWVADHGIPPVVRGYVVLKPRRHVRDLADLTPDEAAGLGTAARRIQAAMRSALAPERIYMCSFVEAVPHLHFHLLPRYPTMPALGPGLLNRLFGGEWSVSDQDAEDAADAIRAALKE